MCATASTASEPAQVCQSNRLATQHQRIQAGEEEQSRLDLGDLTWLGDFIDSPLEEVYNNPYPRRPDDTAAAELREAYNQLFTSLDHHNATEKQHQCHRELRSAYTAPQQRKEDFRTSIFSNLNVLLFEGKLQDDEVCWTDNPHHEGSRAYTAVRYRRDDTATDDPWTVYNKIELDNQIFTSEPGDKRARLWGTLIHEMLHAFANTVLGRSFHEEFDVLEPCTCAGMVCHGPLFDEAARKLAGRLDVVGIKAEDIHDREGKCHTWNSDREIDLNADSGTPMLGVSEEDCGLGLEGFDCFAASVRVG